MKDSKTGECGHPVHGIDIVIPTYNRLLSAGKATENILRQCRGDDRIIVVWQGSLKPTVPSDYRIRMVHLETPNLPCARNAGIRAGKNSVILFIDDDCEVTNGLLDGHRYSYTDELIGGVAGFIDDPCFEKGGDQPSYFDSSRGTIRQNYHIDKSCFTVAVGGGNMSFRRSAIDKIGKFDTNYRGNALWEDVDFAFRIQNAGYRIWYCNNARVIHRRSTTGGCRSSSTMGHLYGFFRNTIYFSCTYAPGWYLLQWLKNWLYHLEYFSRKKGATTRNKLLKYDFKLVVAGITGACAGCICFVLKGRRKQLPEAVLKNNQKRSREAT